jgi:putative ABC transport system permease protein
VPWPQRPGRALNLLVRTATQPEVFAGALRRAVAAIDPEMPIFELSTMEARIADSVAEPRFRTTLLTTFAAIALVMAMVGLYGVMAYSVSQRAGEFGVRLALGARRRDVLSLVLAQGARLTAAGVVAGLTGAFALTRLLSSLLYDVNATDPLTFAVVPLLLIAVALLACWLPARRAANVDPMVALRCE